MKLADKYDLVVQPSRDISSTWRVMLRAEHSGGRVDHLLWDAIPYFDKAWEDAHKAIEVLQVVGAMPAPEPVDEPF